ncbi:MAG: ATP-binding cassette domain-containing protein [Deltaproteobacteria bacterium]|nr:ATP-binding cassette domain-containing protein [Deltaproteobacteria bacterium]
MIEVENLTFAYTGQASIFEDFNLHVGRGETWAVIGPSGCGKSTLLYLLAGLRRPLAGKIVIAGEEIVRPRPETGLILQDHGLLPWATVIENARLGQRIRDFYGPDGKHAPKDNKRKKEIDSSQVTYWLKRLGIIDLSEKYPSQLSRGERQRTAIARTLSLEPDILLMDEPFSALDEPTREDLRDIIKQCQWETNLTNILVTHDIEEAIFVGKKILVLRDGVNREPWIIENNLAGQDDESNRENFALLREKLKAYLGDMP